MWRHEERSEGLWLEINVTAEDPKLLTGPWTAPTVITGARAVRAHHGNVV